MALRLQYAGAGISINDSLEQATQKAENQKNKEAIQGLMLEYNHYGAGVNINDSYEEALKKYNHIIIKLIEQLKLLEVLKLVIV